MDDDSNSDVIKVVSISPNKLIGKDLDSVIERMKVHGLSYRIVTRFGLITADYVPIRYNLMIEGGEDCDNKIVDCWLG